MKVNYLKTILLISVFVVIAGACNKTTKVKEEKQTTSTGQKATVEVEVFDAMKIKDQLIKVINETPDPEEIVEFINKVGASYILDLTIPVTDAEKFMTETQKSFGMGMYVFDRQYAKIFNRIDMVGNTFAISKQFAIDLGLQNELTYSQNYVQRIKDNAENKDSVDYLVTEAMNAVYKSLLDTKEPGIYALSFIGTNIEALYVLSQLTLLAQNNQPMIEFFSKQGERAKSVIMLLELMSDDENVKPYYEKMKMIATYFEEHPTFTEKELKQVSPLIENFRNDIIN